MASQEHSASRFNFNIQSDYHSLHCCDRPISQIPECICVISHSATFCNRMCTYVHISVTKWCIVGYLSDAMWDVWDGSIDDQMRKITVTCILVVLHLNICVAHVSLHDIPAVLWTVVIGVKMVLWSWICLKYEQWHKFNQNKTHTYKRKQNKNKHEKYLKETSQSHQFGTHSIQADLVYPCGLPHVTNIMNDQYFCYYRFL